VKTSVLLQHEHDSKTWGFIKSGKSIKYRKSEIPSSDLVTLSH